MTLERCCTDCFKLYYYFWRKLEYFWRSLLHQPTFSLERRRKYAPVSTYIEFGLGFLFTIFIVTRFLEKDDVHFNSEQIVTVLNEVCTTALEHSLNSMADPYPSCSLYVLKQWQKQCWRVQRAHSLHFRRHYLLTPKVSFFGFQRSR